MPRRKNTRRFDLRLKDAMQDNILASGLLATAIQNLANKVNQYRDMDEETWYREVMNIPEGSRCMFTKDFYYHAIDVLEAAIKPDEG